MTTEQWINFVNSEIEAALALLYSYMQFQKMLENQTHVNRINGNSEFWMLHNGAVQHTLYLYLGRLVDDSKDGKSFSDFNRHCFSNLQEFSRRAFLSRKPDILRVNPRFLEDKTEPTANDMASLFALASPHNGFLREKCREIRSKVFAHAIFTEEYEYTNLFSNVSFEKMEGALLAYWSITQHLWHCFYNARSIEPELLDYPDKEHIFDNTIRAVYGASN